MQVETGPLSAAELAALFIAAGDPPAGQTECLLHLLLETGMRLEEAVTLEPDSVLRGGACVVAHRIRDSNGHAPRFLAVTPALHARLADLGRTGLLFRVPGKSGRQNVQWWRARLRRVFAESGLEGSSVYRLRRTYLASFCPDTPPFATNRRLR